MLSKTAVSLASSLRFSSAVCSSPVSRHHAASVPFAMYFSLPCPSSPPTCRSTPPCRSPPPRGLSPPCSLQPPCQIPLLCSSPPP
ncbi:hypothetical protein PF005_g20979 [Phytophthora fragariae]|uniref:Uncharacterized protein n=1 Tax=Phytophthora fragariae TaxID=53985 RepID=A0A6A3WMP8_9STRA|nr:hypothetical protein PF005_g20979 [Phytophthora fragariae]